MARRACCDHTDNTGNFPPFCISICVPGEMSQFLSLTGICCLFPDACREHPLFQQPLGQIRNILFYAVFHSAVNERTWVVRPETFSSSAVIPKLHTDLSSFPFGPTLLCLIILQYLRHTRRLIVHLLFGGTRNNSVSGSYFYLGVIITWVSLVSLWVINDIVNSILQMENWGTEAWTGDWTPISVFLLNSSMFIHSYISAFCYKIFV